MENRASLGLTTGPPLQVFLQNDGFQEAIMMERMAELETESRQTASGPIAAVVGGCP